MVDAAAVRADSDDSRWVLLNAVRSVTTALALAWVLRSVASAGRPGPGGGRVAAGHGPSASMKT